MMSFKDIKIVYKVTSLIVLLGLVVVAATFFAVSSMMGINSTYSTLVENDAKGALLAVRANTRGVDLARLGTRIATESDMKAVEDTIREYESSQDKFYKYINAAKVKLPKWKPDLEKIGSDYKALESTIEAIKGAARANQGDRAQELVNTRFQPAMTDLRAQVNRITQGVADDLDAVSANTDTSTKRAIMTTVIAVAIGLIAVMLLAVFLTTSSISRPIVATSGVMERLSKRDYGVVIEGTDRKDELGVMARAVAVFKDNMVRADELAAEEEENRKQQALRAQTITSLTTDFDKAISEMLDSTSSAATELETTASSMSATAEQTTHQAASVAAAAEQASANVQTVATASEELAASINEISAQVTQSTKVAANAAQESKRTNEVVLGLAQSAQKIGEVIQLINDIASQTNLLALNATIEAARAGEAGKGFAVVANEVKSLANQTGKATEEISNQINEVQSATQDAVQAIQQIGATIDQINQISTTIASAIEEQGAATREIARNVNEASTGTREVTQNIVGVNEAADATGHAATDVLSTASSMAQQAETLRQVVHNFLDGVRAA